MFPFGNILSLVTSWTLLFFLFIAQFQSGKATEGRVVCYYTNWSVYRPGTAKFNPQNINPYLCTHLIYAFGGFTKDNALKTFDKYQDIEQGGYSKFNGLKSYNKDLKTLLAIGGWNEGSTRFSSLVASPQRRQEFTKNIIKFLRQNHFDGLDLDWEYPSFRGGKSRDRENYAQFVQELREEFELESSKTGRSRLLLTMAVPAGIEYIKKGYDIKKLNKYLDWFNLLSYDYHSAFEPSVNHHAPLYSLEEESEYNYDTELNIDYSIKYYLNEGADRDKLVLGIPTYGRSYTLLNDDVTEIGAPTDGPGAQGDATREKEYLSYYEICQNIMEDPDWTVVQPDPNKMGPYAFKENQWVGYDDTSIARKKGEYVVANGLGGIMFWSIDNDDFRGLCHNRPYPIIEAAKEAMLNGLGLGDNEVVGPSTRRKPSRERSRNTNKITSQTKDNEQTISLKTEAPRRQQNSRRRPSTSTERSDKVKRPVSRTTTPEPPTTPETGADFKCEDEGFYPHPRDCKKYFWCLDSGPSNLGIVAHQFTCPSGLVFNKITDSCDYTRNVQCTSTTTTTARTTTTEPVSTSVKPRTTIAVSRSTFLKRPSTTADTRVIDEEEYVDVDSDVNDDEEDHRQLTGEEEEDPKVLKELIDIIKRLGGLEQLEKQLRQQDGDSTLIKDIKSEQSPTAPTLISKSLYEKVLNSATGRNFLPNSRYTTLFGRNSSESGNSRMTNKYSSVIRNSRPGPQNSGIEEQDDTDTYQERPKYVTINRQSQSPANENDEPIKDKISQDEDDFEDRRSAFAYTTSQPQYVNIQRTRPSTTKSSSENTVESSTRRQYETLNRGKPLAVPNADEESVTITTNRYKTIQRTRTSEATEQPDVTDTPVFINQGQQLMVSENDPALTNIPDTTTRTYDNLAYMSTETITEVSERKTSPRTLTKLTDNGFTDSTIRPEHQTEVPESITVTSDVDLTIDNNQNEVTTASNDLDTYSSTLIPNTPTSSLDYFNDKADQNKKVTTNTITTVGGPNSENQEEPISSISNIPEFHGIVSSPRPFEISKRTKRPSVRFTSSTVATTSSTEIPIIPNKETTTEDESVVFKIGRPTTTPKPTTLHHVFAIDYDEKTEMIPMPVDTEKKTSEVISQRVEKIAEVSRVVEIYSQQETHIGDNKSTQSNLVIEKLPTVNKLGEISRITLIKLVEQSKDNSSLSEIKPTTKARLAKSVQKLILPETIFSVETSTIPLEALFQNERTSKVLSPIDEISSNSNLSKTVDSDKNRRNEILKTEISPTIFKLEPLTTPLVISLANLDKVVLSKSSNKPTSAGNDSDVHSPGKVSTFLTPPQVANKETSKTDSTIVESIDPIVNTQTSYSSEISRVVKKSPKYMEYGVDPPIIDDFKQTDAQPSKKIRPNFRPNFRRPTFSTKKINSTISNEVAPTTESIVPTYQNNRRRRPTTTTTTTSSSVQTTTEAGKFLYKQKYSSRPKIDRRRYMPLSTSTTASTSTVTEPEYPRTTNKFFRRRFNYFSATTAKPKNKTAIESITRDESDRINDSDQKIESSVLEKKFTNDRYSQIGETLKDDGLIEAITAISRAPLPVSVSSTTSKYFKNHSIYKDDNTADDTDLNTEEPATKRNGVIFSTRRTVPRRISTTSATTVNTVNTTKPQSKRDYLRRRRPQSFGRSQRLDLTTDVPQHNQPEYDYYDDSDLGIIAGSKIKVILHDFGIIECLDQGNFPHPLSCRKFITCAKMEIGGVVGWEYTCPKELSFDPVGGMCNYSAGLGCKD